MASIILKSYYYLFIIYGLLVITLQLATNTDKVSDWCTENRMVANITK